MRESTSPLIESEEKRVPLWKKKFASVSKRNLISRDIEITINLHN